MTKIHLVGRWWWGCHSRNPGTQTHGAFPHSHVGIPALHTKEQPTPWWSRKDLALELLWHSWNLFLLSLSLCTATLSIHFSFQSSPDDSSALISSSLFHLFFFFLIKNHKTIWAIFLKNPTSMAHFYYQHFFFKETFRPVSNSQWSLADL